MSYGLWFNVYEEQTLVCMASIFELVELWVMSNQLCHATKDYIDESFLSTVLYLRTHCERCWEENTSGMQHGILFLFLSGIFSDWSTHNILCENEEPLFFPEEKSPFDNFHAICSALVGGSCIIHHIYELEVPSNMHPNCLIVC